MMDDKIILNLLFKDKNLRTCLLEYSKYICNNDVATTLLETSIKYFKDSEKDTDITFDDLDAIFKVEFDTESDEIKLWNEIKELSFSDYDVVGSAVIKHISKQLKEYFFADAFTNDDYDIDKLENLYILLDKIKNYKKDEEVTEDVILTDTKDCCDSYKNNNKEGVDFFDKRISDTLSSNQFDCGTVNVIMGAPGRGKTQLILNQGVHTAEQNKYTLHLALGDLTKRQLILRLLAIITNKPIDQISLLSPEQFENFFTQAKKEHENIFKHLHSKVCLPNVFTGIELIREIEKMQRKRNVHYTQIVIDYDGNIETDLSSNSKSKNDENKSMYYAGADIYNNFVSFAKRNNSVIWILSQPKVQYWSVEKIPLEALSDSSKKGHIVDFCMSIGKKDVTEEQCTLFISKNRHGESYKCFYLQQMGATQKFEPISSWSS